MIPTSKTGKELNDYLSDPTSRQFEILDSAGQAVIATDVGGSIGYWNDAAERLYGWKREEVIGQNIVDVTPADQSREDGESIMRLLAVGELWSGIFTVRDRMGRSFDAAVTDIPLRRDGRTVGVVGVSAENTAAAEIETTLQRFASRQQGRERIEISGHLGGMTAQASEPHLIQLFTILLLKLHDVDEDAATITILAQRSTPRLSFDFGIDSAREWLYMSFSPETPHGRADAVRNTLRSLATTRYGASLVQLAGGKLFARNLPRSGAAFHLFLPVE